MRSSLARPSPAEVFDELALVVEHERLRLADDERGDVPVVAVLDLVAQAQEELDVVPDRVVVGIRLAQQSRQRLHDPVALACALTASARVELVERAAPAVFLVARLQHL